jgi:ubiquinone/menaquinone biosynthesis C-methylase UbiE
MKQLILHSQPSPKNILEIGCASGHLTSLLADLFPKAKVTGIDIYTPAIKAAKSRFPHINFKVADAQKLPFASDTFDLVLTSETIEHVLDPAQMLHEIGRVLKSSGKALIEMDSGSLLFRLIWFGWSRWGKGRVWKEAHLHPFTSEELESLIKNNGLDVSSKVLSHLGMAVTFLVTPKKTAKKLHT